MPQIIYIPKIDLPLRNWHDHLSSNYINVFRAINESMLLKLYGVKIIQAFLAAVCLAASLLTFGESLYFDRIFFGALFLVALSSYRNINIIGIICIIGLERLLEESIWIWVKDLDLAKPLIYGISAYTLYIVRHDLLAKYFGIVLLLAISIENYWIITQYSPPLIHWYVAMTTLNMFTRYLLLRRVSIIAKYTNKAATPLAADWQLSDIAGLSVIIQAWVLFEFIARHVGELSDLLYIYNIMPYTMNVLAFVTIWCIANESTKFNLKETIQA